MLNCLENALKLTPIWQLCHSCQILDLINFQNNLTWNHSWNQSRFWAELQYYHSQVCKQLSVQFSLVLEAPYWYRFHPFYLSVSPVLWHKCQRVFPFSCTPARHAGRFDFWWPASFWLQWTVAEGNFRGGSLANFPAKPTEELKKENVCNKTNQDLCRIPGHATQISAGFVRYTRASAYRPQPRFLTNQPWPG